MNKYMNETKVIKKKISPIIDATIKKHQGNCASNGSHPPHAIRN
jgi:hypothetical protein